MSLAVNIEDLAASGVAVTGHGEDVAAKHAGADGRIEAAQPGWQGASAMAMVTMLYTECPPLRPRGWVISRR